MGSLGKGSTALEADTKGLRRSMSNQNGPAKFKFPDFLSANDEAVETDDESLSRDPSPRPHPNSTPNGLHTGERWTARTDTSNRKTWSNWTNGRLGAVRHSRQKSLSEAIRTVRTRKASFNESAHEIADSLKAPVSFKLVVRLQPNSFPPPHFLG